jgi:plastocyanin
VTIAGLAFTPERLTISVGSTVTWTNYDEEIHTVTSDDGIFESGSLIDNGSWSYTFDELGVFTYHCTPHPFMKALVIVE